MMTAQISQKSAILGIVEIVATVAVLAVTHAPAAQAQTESYITDADLAAACEGVCNTFVPPHTEDECEELHRDQFNEETLRHHDRSGHLANRQAEEWEESEGIFFDEMDALEDVRDERIAIARAVCVTRIAGASAALTACLAKVTVTGPGAIAGAALCVDLYTAAVAGFIVTLNREVGDAKEDFGDANELAAERLEDREDKIKALYNDRLILNEVSRHESAIALIGEDLRLCLQRVNN